MELKLTSINTKLFFLPFLVKEMARTHTSLQLPIASKSVKIMLSNSKPVNT